MNPLDWSPGSADEKVPDEVFDARCALLTAGDRERLKADFDSGRDPLFKFLFFGGDAFGDLGKNSSALMTRCVFVGVDRDASLRLFEASAYGCLVEEKFVPKMLDEAVEFVGEFREEMAKIRRYRAPRASSGRAVRPDCHGKEI